MFCRIQGKRVNNDKSKGIEICFAIDCDLQLRLRCVVLESEQWDGRENYLPEELSELLQTAS